jgi:putative transposase
MGRLYYLKEEQWLKIRPLAEKRLHRAGGTAIRDPRLFVEAVLWIARTGSPWRDLPEEYGKWQTVYARFHRWIESGRWDSILKALSSDSDTEYVIIDGTIVRAHQHSASGKKKENQLEQARVVRAPRFMRGWRGLDIFVRLHSPKDKREKQLRSLSSLMEFMEKEGISLLIKPTTGKNLRRK